MKNNLKKVYFRPDFYFETAKDVCLHLGFSVYDIANVTGCHPKTAHKWINSNKPPRWLLPYLYAVSGGVISCNSFYGWQLKDGYVSTPATRYALTCSEVESLPWFLDTLKQSQAKLAHIEKHQAIKKAGIPPKIIAFKNGR